MNLMKFVTNPSNKNGDDVVWYALAMIRLNFHSDDVWVVVRDCILDCVCFYVSDRNDHGVVLGVLLVVV